MLEFPNAARFASGLQAWMENVEDLVEGVYRGMAVRCFKYVLQETPQWSGNAAANWNFSIGTVDVSFDPEIFVSGPTADLGAPTDRLGFIEMRRKGDQVPINYALARNQGQDKLVRLELPIFISNSVDHGEGPYAWALELNQHPDGGQAFLREINRPGEMVHRAVQQFENMATMTLIQALSLTQERL